jgi:hypothetical protein
LASAVCQIDESSHHSVSVFVNEVFGQFTAEGNGAVMQQDAISMWIQNVGSIATAVGVLIALGVALIWEPKKIREDRRRYDDQLATLQRAESDRIAAQARKVVPSVNRADIFGENLWMVRVNDTSTAVGPTYC